MRLILDNVSNKHFKWLLEMAKTLDFKVVDIELIEDEEDKYLLQAMEEGRQKPETSIEEVEEFKKYLSSI